MLGNDDGQLDGRELGLLLGRADGIELSLSFRCKIEFMIGASFVLFSRGGCPTNNGAVNRFIHG